MDSNILKKITFKGSDSIRKVLSEINKSVNITNGKGFGIIVDENNKCIGVVSDGDIRRKLLTDVGLDEKVNRIMNKDFKYVKVTDSDYVKLKKMSMFNNLPILGRNNILLDFVNNEYNLSINNNNYVRARVPLRISFSGGGTDFSKFIDTNSTKVLTSTIDRYFTTSIRIRSDRIINIYSHDYAVKCRYNDISKITYDGTLDLIKGVIKTMKPSYGFDLETSSDVEPGTGLGGSTALIISLISAFNYFNINKLNLQNICETAYKIERIDHKIQGGWQDHYSTAYGGFNLIDFTKKDVLVTPLKLRNDIFLELEYCTKYYRFGKIRNSSEIHKGFLDNFSASQIKYFTKQMGKITNLLKDNLLKGNLSDFGKLLNETWKLKKLMNNKVTNNKLNLIYSQAVKNGALGGKLLGAGEAGYIMLYVPYENQNTVNNIMLENNTHIENIKFTVKGIDIWQTSY